jgi:DNA polymerase II large subunit
LSLCEIQGDGYISENLRKKIFSTTWLWDYGFAFVCLNAAPRRAGMKDPTSNAETSNADVVVIIEDRLERLGALKEYVFEREKLAEDAEARSFSLPSASATDKLLRYEAHVDRRLSRTMDQLERLQRQRKGENVPPPLNINLGRRSQAFLRNKAKKLFDFRSWLVDLHGTKPN